VVADTDHHRLVTASPGTGVVTPLTLASVTPPSVRGPSSARFATQALPLQHLEDAAVATTGGGLELEVRLPEGDTFTAVAPRWVELPVAGARCRFSATAEAGFCVPGWERFPL